MTISSVYMEDIFGFDTCIILYAWLILPVFYPPM